MKLNSVPIVYTGVTAVGASGSNANVGAIPVDTRETGTFAFNITYSAGNTTATGNLQYTLDDVYAPGYNPANGNWLNVGAVLAYAAPPLSQMIQLTGSNAVLATAFRLNITTSTGTVSAQGWQNVTSVT